MTLFPQLSLLLAFALLSWTAGRVHTVLVDVLYKLHYPEVSARRLNVASMAARKMGVSCCGCGRGGTSGAVVLTCLSCAGPVRQSTDVEAPKPGRGPLPARPFGIQPERTIKERTSLHTFVTTHDPRSGTGGPTPRCPPGLRSFRGLRARALSSSAPRGVTLKPVRVFNWGTDAPCDGQPKVTRPCGSVGFRLSFRSALGTPWRQRR